MHKHFRQAIEISRKFPTVCGCLELKKSNSLQKTHMIWFGAYATLGIKNMFTWKRLSSLEELVSGILEHPGTCLSFFLPKNSAWTGLALRAVLNLPTCSFVRKPGTCANTWNMLLSSSTKYGNNTEVLYMVCNSFKWSPAWPYLEVVCKIKVAYKGDWNM